MDYGKAVENFVNTLCEGRQYDSCVNSPCRWSGAGGCRHPQHPKHAQPPEREQHDHIPDFGTDMLRALNRSR